MNQDHQDLTTITTDELRDDQLDKVTGGGKKNTTNSGTTVSESLTLSYGTVIFSYS